jgi:DNA primase
MKAAELHHLWQRVLEVYRRRLLENPVAAELLRGFPFTDALVWDQFQAGYGDGTVASLLPPDGELRELMAGSGMLKTSGQETLLGCLVLPLVNHRGDITGFCGIKPTAEGAFEEMVVPAGAFGLVRSALARDGSALHVTTRALDALALWAAGIRNVVALAGGVCAARELAELITAQAHRCIRWCAAEGKEPNAFFQELRDSLRQDASVQLAQVPWPQGVTGAWTFLQTHTASEFEALLPRPGVTGTEPPGDLSPAFTETPGGLDACLEGRRYELRAIQKPSPGRLRATVRALGENGRFVAETVDFYCSRSRRGLVVESARLFHQPLEVIERDLTRMIDTLENHLQKQTQARIPRAGVVEAADRAEGLKLGRAPDLVGEILHDMGSLGVIGEDSNKLLSYLVMTSRKLPEPLALLILSGSGAGKSYLQDTVLALCPEEDLVKLTSLTSQALFYRGEDSLRHKVLALEEQAGAKGADYPLRNLISARKLVIETTVKSPVTGRLETQVNTVYGPTAVFQTTTNPHTDAETRSRFLLMSVDESPEQTRAILQRQRQAHTLESLRRCQNRERILRRHHAFQRLLRRVTVINPFEPLLSYPDRHLQVRRDHPKYLQLILASAFVHQMQRPLRQDPELGDYVEATLEDVALANGLAHRFLGNSLADLSAPARDLFSLIQEHLQGRAPTNGESSPTFSRRELREAIHWSDTRLRVHLHELVDLEFVGKVSGRIGTVYRYQLLGQAGDGPGRFLPGLKSVEQLRNDASLAGIYCHVAPASQRGKSEVAPGTTDCGASTCGNAAATSHIFQKNIYVQEPPEPRRSYP